MIQTIDFAPLDGITKIVFRQVWSQFFGGVDRYFIPFFSPTPHHLMTPRDLREVDYIHNANLPSVPQVMTKNADDFLWACDVLKDMGYTEVNLNLGCPSGTVTAKGKGSGFLAHPNELAAFFDEVFSKNPLPVSVKTRLGYETPEEFADQHAENLPYGKQRLLEIARALATDMKLLLLDEPAAGMNPVETAELKESIKMLREKFQIPILLIEHDMKFVMNICDRLYVLDYGVQIAQGLPCSS